MRAKKRLTNGIFGDIIYDMKKFRYVFPISAYVLFGLLLAISAVSVVLASLRLGNAGGFFSVYPVTDVISIVVFSIAFASVLCSAFVSSYAFCGDAFVFTRLFSKKRINKKDLIKLVTDEASGVSALYYYGVEPGDKQVSFIVISIGRKNREPFESALREFKRDIVMEITSSDRADD